MKRGVCITKERLCLEEEQRKNTEYEQKTGQLKNIAK
jgi:hypothetical protein